MDPWTLQIRMAVKPDWSIPEQLPRLGVCIIVVDSVCRVAFGRLSNDAHSGSHRSIESLLPPPTVSRNACTRTPPRTVGHTPACPDLQPFQGRDSVERTPRPPVPPAHGSLRELVALLPTAAPALHHVGAPSFRHPAPTLPPCLRATGSPGDTVPTARDTVAPRATGSLGVTDTAVGNRPAPCVPSAYTAWPPAPPSVTTQPWPTLHSLHPSHHWRRGATTLRNVALPQRPTRWRETEPRLMTPTTSDPPPPPLWFRRWTPLQPPHRAPLPAPAPPSLAPANRVSLPTMIAPSPTRSGGFTPSDIGPGTPANSSAAPWQRGLAVWLLMSGGRQFLDTLQ